MSKTVTSEMGVLGKGYVCESVGSLCSLMTGEKLNNQVDSMTLPLKIGQVCSQPLWCQGVSRKLGSSYLPSTPRCRGYFGFLRPVEQQAKKGATVLGRAFAPDQHVCFILSQGTAQASGAERRGKLENRFD